MGNKYSTSMFDALKTAMAEQRSGGSFKDILKTSIGNTYLVRLIPNINDISKTMYHYFSHGWQSLATGQFISCLCPTTNGQRCPICEERVRLYRGDEEDKKNAKLLGRKEQWLINAYVVDDPVNVENNGMIKIVRYGKQLDKVIRDATEGDDSEEIGARAFDLSENGCNLRIKVEKNDGGYPTYISSKFLRESEIRGMDDDKIDEVYKNLFDLEKVFESKTPEEVKDMLDTHFFCEVTSTTDVSTRKEIELDEDGEIVDSSSDEDETVKEESSNEKMVDDSSDSVQDKLNDLMKDL